MLTLRTKLGDLYYENGKLLDSDKRRICYIDYNETPSVRKIQSIEDLVDLGVVNNAIWDTSKEEMYYTLLDILFVDDDDYNPPYSDYIQCVNRLGDIYFVVDYDDIW